MGTTIPRNQASFSVDELVAITGGVLEHAGSVSDQAVGISTDTRTLDAGNVFVALPGEHFDGHTHAQAASQKGAAVVIASRAVEVLNGTAVVRVKNSLAALGQLAREHRRRWATAGPGSKRVIAVTGSAGKTTTCRAVSAVLGAHAPERLHRAAGNMNNAIGIPMVLLGLRADHDVVVVEVGTNSPGEIAYGASLAEPDVAVLTLVACAHTLGLGSIEKVAEEKGALLHCVPSEGAIVVNGDDAHVMGQVPRAKAQHVIVYGAGPSADVKLTSRRLVQPGVQLLGYEVRKPAGGSEAIEIRTSMLGNAGAYAMAAALGVALAERGQDLDVRQAARVLEAAQGESGRLKTRALESGAVLIDDAYNANPASMADSVAVAAEMAEHEGRRAVLVLGEMRELGTHSRAQHEALGRQVAASGASLLIAVGGDARFIAHEAGAAGVASFFVPDAREAARLALASVAARDVVLIKGSRGIALERVVDALASGVKEAIA